MKTLGSYRLFFLFVPCAMKRLRCRNQRQLNKTRQLAIAGRVVDPLGGFAIVAGLGPEDVRDKGLRIATAGVRFRREIC